MSNEAQRWKDKYLAGLEQQEQLERRWETRFDLLRRGLVRSSLAAEGADKTVDQCLQELREILRRDDMDGGLSALIPRLEKTLLDSEQRRQQRVAQVAEALLALVGQLLELEVPREVRRALKNYARQLAGRVGQVRELPVLLGELSQLQEQALSVLARDEQQRPGLLQRLFAGRDSASRELPVAAEAASPVARTAQPATAASPAAVPAGESSAPGGQAAAGAALALDSLPLPADLLPSREPSGVAAPLPADPPGDPDYALPAAPEPGYSAIASHVEASLLGLLAELPLPEHHQAQAELLQQRIEAGLNLYELVPVLDDLAVLLLAMADVGQREFEGYLKQLNERLASFQGNLQEAHDGYADSISVARELDSELRQQVDGLHSSVQQATDLGSLKSLVESRLDGLLGTMQQYQQQRDEREQRVAGRLQTLVERVASMEQEAQGFRQHLEEQRQKALTDPLTGLPNRAAWIERLDLEQARWQRYGGELQLAVLDIDHFKRINDQYGHLAGDKVLKIIAGELRKRLRKTDFLARFGGEEFVLLMPATPREGGLQLLQNLREGVAACPFHFRGERLIITLSAGVAAFAAGEGSEQVFERADQALYRAKRGGRNRIDAG